MKFLLIDCCSLLHLISDGGYNTYLIDLENGINQKKITFLTHKHIISEWEKHKDEQISRIKKKILKKSCRIVPSNLISQISTNDSEEKIAFIDTQVEQIDSLLNSSLILQTPVEIEHEFATRYREKLAPFHKKKDSQNDWEIIGSLCQYCLNNGIIEVNFVSHNSTEFSDESEIKIHPSIQSRFPELSINYYRDYSIFFDEISAPDVYTSPALLNNMLPTNEKYTYKSSLKENPIDALLFLFDKLYKEINFIPLHILRKYYPFASSDQEANYRNFTMYNVNPQTVSFFENIEIINAKEVSFNSTDEVFSTNEFKQKTEKVLKHLTSNLIYYIPDTIPQRTKTIFLQDNASCECIACKFDRLIWHKTFIEQDSPKAEYKIRMKQAYINSKLGNFETSCQQFINIANDASISKDYITFFISKYNVEQLKRFLSNAFYHDKKNTSLLTQIKDYDSIEDAIKLKSNSDYNLLKFIAKDEFFTDAYQNILREVNAIREHYYSQLNGGWSSNNHISSLIQEFAKLYAFLNSNFIIFDQYSNFSELFEYVTEGLLTSYAISPNQGHRFSAIDDYWIHKFIFYGKKETILKYCNQLHIKKIKYKQSENDTDSYINWVQNFLGSAGSIRVLSECDTGVNEYFIDIYNRVFENMLSMAALLDLSNSSIERIAILLLDFLNNDKFLHPKSLESVRLFFKKTCSSFSESTFQGLFHYFLTSHRDIDNQTIEVLVQSSTPRQLVKVSDEDIKLIIAQSTSICEKCGNEHSVEILIPLYKKSKTRLKAQITELVKARLINRYSFRLYYLASLNNIIRPKKSELYALVDGIQIENNQSTQHFFFKRAGYMNNQLDELINLCFKIGIPTNTTRFERFKSIHPYYEWLIDMDLFDYSKFKPEWVMNYGTQYYYNAMAKSKKLIEALTSYLYKHHHAGIEKILIKITYYSS